MKVKAVAKDVGISPMKVRLVVDMVRNKKVGDALDILNFVPTPTAKAVAKLIKSAASNAENNFQMSLDDLKIVAIFADKGHTLKRHRPQSRGRVSPILKRSSCITVFVDEEEK
ncbi:MAG: 50S ribosomal protein L22 [Dehalococcoidia bacterium]|nr:50S ribosomal protein L22 [Dehalococcoidia bacterium]